jgi:Tol biopolymer transport system component
MVLAAAAWLAAQNQNHNMFRFPATGGDRIRTEAQLLPEVSTGPIDPCWSPDGKWIAFSMRGDIWKIPAEGGTAVALTKGPVWHYEPAWSPDGRFLALSMDVNRNLEIGIVPAEGGEVRTIASHPQVDIEPAWSADSKGLYFSSARGGSFAIYYAPIDGGAVTQVPGLQGTQLSPAASPDGKSLAYVAPVRGRTGNGGIWVKSLAGGDPRLVAFEESGFHAKPKWSPDSAVIVYTSEESGTADIAAVPAQGGTPARLTFDAGDEFSPAYSPDGSRIAFFTNYDGPAHLMTMPAGGARRQGWTEVPMRARRSAVPTGKVRVRIVGPDGKTTPARVTVNAADGRSYAPDGGFHRMNPVIDTHYFPSSGQFEVEVPAGKTQLFAMKGSEYVPAKAEVDAHADATAQVELKLTRLIDGPAMGWYSGDTHTHDLHDGRFGLTHERYFEMLVGEDLHAANDLIHMDGTQWMGRPADLSGEPYRLSTPTHILQYAEEFRGSLGHIGLLGIHEFAMPPVGGTPNTAYADYRSNYSYVDAAHAQGGIAGYMHPYSRRVAKPEDGAGSEIVVDVALGKGDFYDVTNVPYDDMINAEMYYRYLNAGFRLPATGGSDDFGNSWNGAPPGTSRTYAHVEGRFTMNAWLAAIKAGRTFGTTGPLLFLTVNGKEPGSEIRTAGPVDLRVRCEVASIAPLDKVEWIVNGKVAKMVPAKSGRYTLEDTLHLDGSAWVAARAIGPSSATISDDYAFAQTTPVYVVRDGKPYVSADDAEFLDAMVAALWQRLEGRAHFASEAARKSFQDSVEQARHTYQDLARKGVHEAR